MVIEPWFLNATVLKQHGIILDEQNQRVFFVGKQATQIWILNCDYSSCQYIWYGGMEDESWKISPSIYLRIDRTTLTRQGWKVEGFIGKGEQCMVLLLYGNGAVTFL